MTMHHFLFESVMYDAIAVKIKIQLKKVQLH